jgi:hypothetical protein
MNIASAARTGLFYALAAVSTGAWANSYAIVDLNANVTPQAINDSGEVAGNGGGEGNGSKGKEYRGGRWHNLSPQSFVNAINGQGGVVGAARRDGLDEPVLWQPNKPMMVIPFPAHSINGGEARTLADDRTVVGVYWPSGQHCFAWTPHVGSVDVGSLPGQEGCIPFAGNNVGQFVGIADKNAFVWKAGVFTIIRHLNGFGGLPEPHAINNNGVAVGYMDPNLDGSDTHAFLWNGQTKDLDPQNQYRTSQAVSINDAGEVVGNASHTDFIWDGRPVRFDGTNVILLRDEVTNLGSWDLVSVSAINNLGQIVGFGSNGGHGGTFLLIPQ